MSIGDLSITDSQLNKAGSTVWRAHRGEPLELAKLERACQVVASFQPHSNTPSPRRTKGTDFPRRTPRHLAMRLDVHADLLDEDREAKPVSMNTPRLVALGY